VSDFDFDSALEAQVARQIGDTPPAEATEDDILGKYGGPEDPDNPDVVALDDDVEDDDVVVEDEVDADEEADDELDPAARKRDEKGRFAPDDDPIVQEYLDRFGGDLEKAIKSAAHQTSKIGEQGKELGELRQAVTQMQSMLLEQQQQASHSQPAPVAPGELDDAIEEDPGAVVHWAFANGQEAVYEEAVSAWYEIDPKAAARFERAVEMEALKAELAQPRDIPPDKTAVIAQLSARHADFADVISSATPAELEGLDRSIVEQIEAVNPAAAFEMVYNHVKVNRPAGAATTSQDEGGAAEREAAAAATRTAKREAAAVARGTSRPASGDTSTMDALRDSMLSPDPFNVQRGLREAG